MNNEDRDLSSELVKTDEVIGRDVKNMEDDNLGEIKEIVLEKVSGKARYVVLAYDEWFGLADKLFALPWKAISYDKNENCFRMNISKEKIKNSPGFDKDNWPDMADIYWSEKINNYYEI